MNWLPIETAPKDETEILLYGRLHGDEHMRSGFWGSEPDDGNWYDHEAASHSLPALGFAPTHWMPLPEAPL